MDHNQIEKESYRPSSYRAVQKLRVRGAEYGIDIPYLQYPLTAPRTGGKRLKVLVIISAVLLAVGLGLLGWGAAGVLVPWIQVAADGTANLMDAVKNIPLINLIGGVGVVVMWLFIFLFLIVALVLALGALTYLLSLLRVANMTTEEKAHGYYLSNLKSSTLVGGIGFGVAGVLAVIFLPPLGVICLVVAAYAITLYVLLQKERNQAKALFDQLPEAQKADFLAHNKALCTASSLREIKKYNQREDYRGLGKWAWLMRLLAGFVDARLVYNNIKQRPEFRQKSTGLARRALRELILFGVTVLLTVGGVWLLSASFLNIEFFRILLMIAGGISILGELLIMIPQTLNLSIKQIILNKHPLGWLTLFLTLALVAAAVGLLFWVATL